MCCTCALSLHTQRDKTHVEPSRKLHSALLKFSASSLALICHSFLKCASARAHPRIYTNKLAYTHTQFIPLSVTRPLSLSLCTHSAAHKKQNETAGTCTWLRLGNFRAFYCARRVKNKAPKIFFLSRIIHRMRSFSPQHMQKGAAAEIWRTAPDEIFTLAPADFDFWSRWWWIQKVRAWQQSVSAAGIFISDLRAAPWTPHKKTHVAVISLFFGVFFSSTSSNDKMWA